MFPRSNRRTSTSSLRWVFTPTAAPWSTTGCPVRARRALLHLPRILSPVFRRVTDPQPRLARVAQIAQPTNRRARLGNIVIAMHRRQRLELRTDMNRIARQHDALVLEPDLQRAFTRRVARGLEHHDAAVAKDVRIAREFAPGKAARRRQIIEDKAVARLRLGPIGIGQLTLHHEKLCIRKQLEPARMIQMEM